MFNFTKPKKNPRDAVQRDMAIFGLISRDTFETVKAAVGYSPFPAYAPPGFALNPYVVRGRFFFEMFKVVMATLLAIFVPQLYV